MSKKDTTKPAVLHSKFVPGRYKLKVTVKKIPKRNWNELIKSIKNKPRIPSLMFDWEHQNEF